MVIRLLIGLVLASGAAFWFASRPIEHPPGILVPEAPLQTEPANDAVIRHRGYHLQPVATFSAEGRVLGLQRYRDDRARLAPFDLAIGWGPMSDSAILDGLAIEQLQRAYRWSNVGAPLSTREVIRHSTNIHLVPATAAVEGRLGRIRPGQLVTLSGRLVDVHASDGSRWRTSRTRTDAGMGACEILWLESIEVTTP